MSPYTEESWEREERHDRAMAELDFEPNILGATSADMGDHEGESDGTPYVCGVCKRYTSNQWGTCIRCDEAMADYDDTLSGSCDVPSRR